MQSQGLSQCTQLQAASPSDPRSTETFSVTLRRQKVVDQVMKVQRGLSHRDATGSDLFDHAFSVAGPPDPPIPNDQYASRQLAGRSSFVWVDDGGEMDQKIKVPGQI